MNSPISTKDQFEQNGFVGPLRVLSPAACTAVLTAYRKESQALGLDWPKGRTVTSRLVYELASHPSILQVVSEFLDHKVMLWGAELLTRKPGAIHPWHSDIESSICGGKTVSVWIGLENTTQDSALILVRHSHQFGATIQEVQQQQEHARDTTTDDDVQSWARQRDPRAELVRPNVGDGEAIFFDGCLWHGSDNRSTKSRRALLLQFATPDTAMRIPDLNYLRWPFRLLDVPRPPCLLLRGSADPAVNRVVPAPVSRTTTARGSMNLTSRVQPLRLPLEHSAKGGWKPYPVFKGVTADMLNISFHASTMEPGHCVHPPHQHQEEEFLMVLSGEVDLELPEANPSAPTDRVRLHAGEFVYYPAMWAHTVHGAGAKPANYVVIKWHNGNLDESKPSMAYGLYAVSFPPLSSRGFVTNSIFSGPTRWMRRLACHTTTLAPGAGYEPHIDPYDVILIMLEGEVQTLGTRAVAHDVIFYRAGEPHGMHNPGQSPARYVVFEFHGRTQLEESRAVPHAIEVKTAPPMHSRLKKSIRSVLKRLQLTSK